MIARSRSAGRRFTERFRFGFVTAGNGRSCNFLLQARSPRDIVDS